MTVAEPSIGGIVHSRFPSPGWNHFSLRVAPPSSAGLLFASGGTMARIGSLSRNHAANVWPGPSASTKTPLRVLGRPAHSLAGEDIASDAIVLDITAAALV